MKNNEENSPKSQIHPKPISIRNKKNVVVTQKVDRDCLKKIHRQSIAGKRATSLAMMKSSKLMETEYSD